MSRAVDMSKNALAKRTARKQRVEEMAEAFAIALKKYETADGSLKVADQSGSFVKGG